MVTLLVQLILDQTFAVTVRGFLSFLDPLGFKLLDLGLQERALRLGVLFDRPQKVIGFISTPMAS